MTQQCPRCSRFMTRVGDQYECDFHDPPEVVEVSAEQQAEEQEAEQESDPDEICPECKQGMFWQDSRYVCDRKGSHRGDIGTVVKYEHGQVIRRRQEHR